MAASPRTVVLAITGPLERSDLPGLLERAYSLLEDGAADLLVCDLSGVAADAVAVDALARLTLAARRHGSRVRLRGASTELRSLAAFLGLADVVGE